MSSISFFKLVKQMRDAQKNYFATRSVEYLRESKVLERRVDEEIEKGDRYMYDHPEEFL